MSKLIEGLPLLIHSQHFENDSTIRKDEIESLQTGIIKRVNKIPTF